jgi:hypothetical protein
VTTAYTPDPRHTPMALAPRPRNVAVSPRRVSARQANSAGRMRGVRIRPDSQKIDRIIRVWGRIAANLDGGSCLSLGPTMSIRYSGTVYRVTSSLEEALARLLRGLEPDADPIPAGIIEVAGSQADIDDGSFAITVSDRPDVFEPYRLKVTERVLDPCADERSWLRSMQSQLEVARREGLSSQALRGLGQRVREAHQRLNECVQRNAPAGPATMPLVFRSLDVYRTGNAEEDDLRVYIRALSSADWQFLRTTHGVTVTERIPYQTLRAEIEKQLPPGMKIDLVSRVNANTIRLDIRTVKATFSVRGHINIRLEPSIGSNYRSFIRVTRSEVDLHGIIGGIAGLAVREEELADRAVASFEAGLNNDLASQLGRLFEMNGSLTVGDIIAEREGFRIIAMIGVLVGGRKDPCQRLRDRVLIQERELAVSLREGLASQTIARHREDLRLRRQAVDDCRARN